jgi:hypothetical protein
VLVGGVPGAIALCVIGGVKAFGVTMVMSRSTCRAHRHGLGLSIGLSIGLGGIAAVILGAVADSVDLRTAFYVCAAARPGPPDHAAPSSRRAVGARLPLVR